MTISREIKKPEIKAGEALLAYITKSGKLVYIPAPVSVSKR